MMSAHDIAQILLALIFTIGIICVLTNRLRMDTMALALATILGLLQLAGLPMLGPANSPASAVNALAGFSQPVIITIISLYAVTLTLEKAGINYWIANRILRLGGQKTSIYILIFAASAASLSLIMNNFAAGALLLPSALEVSYRTQITPSKLLIPVAYGSLLGGSATYFTTANMVISDLLPKMHPAQLPTGFLDYFFSGIIIVILGLVFFYFLGDRLLPEHQPSNQHYFYQLTDSELEDFFQISERVWEAKIQSGGEFANITLSQSGIGENWGISVAAIINEDGYSVPYPTTTLKADMRLLLIGREEKISELRTHGLLIGAHKEKTYLSSKGISIIELILSPHSRYVGKTVTDIRFRDRYGGTVIGIRRTDRSYRTDVGKLPLNSGDSLLIIGSKDQLENIEKFNDFIIIKAHHADQPINKKGALLSLGLLLLVIVLSLFNLPVYLLMMSAAILLILSRQISVDDLYHSIHWQAIFIIAGMFVVSTAITETGLVDRITSTLNGLSHQNNLVVFAVVSYLLSGVITQFVGGQVAAFITGPITLGAAVNAGINPHAIAVATAIGCSASFLLPLAHPVNIMMIGPGSYRMKDFFKIGIWLTLVCLGGLILSMLIFWR